MKITPEKVSALLEEADKKTLGGSGPRLRNQMREKLAEWSKAKAKEDFDQAKKTGDSDLQV